MHLFHKWSNWEQFTVVFQLALKWAPDRTFEEREKWQRRRCQVCNKIQEERVG